MQSDSRGSAAPPAWLRDEILRRARAHGEAAPAEEGAQGAGDPYVEIAVEGDRVHFVFDAMLWFLASSGSDWYRDQVFDVKFDRAARVREIAARTAGFGVT